MNNLILTLLVLSASACCWLGGHFAAQSTVGNNRRLTGDLALARRALLQREQIMSELGSSLEQRRREWREAQVALEGLANPAAAILADNSLSGERVWPAEKPYFYLAKRHLGDIDYPTINPRTSSLGEVTPVAATLFGMTREEQEAVNQAFGVFARGLIERQRARAVRLPDDPGIQTEQHREIACRVPVLTNEIARLQEDFAAAIEAALGPTRAALYAPKAAEQFLNVWKYDQSVRLARHTLGEDYLIIYQAKRLRDGGVIHGLVFCATDRSQSTTWAFYYPTNGVEKVLNTPLWQYRHLFGDQPLLTADKAKE